MKFLALPLLDSNANLGTALELMRGRQRSGVVLRDGSDFHLVEASSVVVGLSKNVGTLGDLYRRTALHRPTTLDLSEKGVDLVTPAEGAQALHDVLASAGGPTAGILAAADDTAIIFSNSEDDYRILIIGPRDCYCDLEEHENDQSRRGLQCLKCKGIVVCSP